MAPHGEELQQQTWSLSAGVRAARARGVAEDEAAWVQVGEKSMTGCVRGRQLKMRGAQHLQHTADTLRHLLHELQKSLVDNLTLGAGAMQLRLFTTRL